MASSASKSPVMKKWIDLNDPNGAKLKVGTFQERLILIIEGVRPRSETFHRVISDLGFTPSKSGGFLVKALNSVNDPVTTAFFRPVWPQATLRMMDVSGLRLDLEKLVRKFAPPAEADASAANSDLGQGAQPQHGDLNGMTAEESIAEVLNRATYLGRNRDGQKVFHSASGRFLVEEADKTDRLVYEARNGEGTASANALFLRSGTQSDVRECAKGLLRAAEKGECLNVDALLRFTGAVLQKEQDIITAEDRDLIAQALDSAILENLVEFNETAGSAWGDAKFYQEMMPGRAAFATDSSTTPYLPVPIAIQVQRFLSGVNSITVEGKIPGFGFGLLDENTRVFVQDPDTLDWGSRSFHRPIVESLSTQNIPAEGGYLRISGDTSSGQINDFFDGLADNAICVATAGTLEPLAQLRQHAGIVQALQIPHWLAGTEKPIYLFVLKRGLVHDLVPVTGEAKEIKPTQVLGWNELKSLVDESLLRLGKEKEANEVVGEGSQRSENRYQRPYIAFSKNGTASTMVPQNMQAALAYALSRVEDVHGGVDDFVADELGIGDETLAKRFSPEQIDAIALSINRLMSGRGFILGDETGIGKGRVLAGICTWANKQGKRVIFLTDRANLFSDLARDLIDIQEWERFRPIITNTDGMILDIMGDADVLATPPTATELKRLMAMDPQDLPSNLILSTYTQINNDESEKARWLQSLAPDAIVVLDEAHIAAGSDSNIARQIQTITDMAAGVIYSSATWAKSSENLHIYSRALPESVNINQVVTAMRENGDSFGETFSSMLAMDGAFIRREHDLSKIDFVVEYDEKYVERNTKIAGQISEILGMMAMLSGDIRHMLQRMSSTARTAIQDARAARQAIASASTTRRMQLEQEGAVKVQAAHDMLTKLAGEIPVMEQVFNSIGPRPDTSIDKYQSAEEVRHWSPLILRIWEGRRTEVEAEEGFEEEVTPLIVQLAQAYEARVDAERILEDARRASQDERSSLQTEEKATRAQLFSSNFGTGGAIYQVMRRTLAALQVDSTADKVIEAARAGRRPVIAFEETGETFVRQFLEEEAQRIKDEVDQFRQRQARGEMTGDDETTRTIADLLDKGARAVDIVQQVRVPTMQDMMRNLLARLGGVKVEELGEPDPTTKEFSVALVAQGRLTDLPGIDQTVVDKYLKGVQEITARIDDLPMLPIVPVDALRTRLTQAGISLGEISGRTFSLDPINPEDWGVKPVYAKLTKRARKKVDVTHTVKMFNAAKYEALALNKSAATGVSVHASPRFPDSRQRHLFELQSDENPTTRIQIFGRVNRFDQEVPPIISMMNTGLKGEMRTIMMQNKKLTNLSANIRSSRENAALIEDVPDLLTRTGDRVCQEYLLENPGIAGRLDIPMERIKMPYGLSHLVTQRVVLLSPRDQDKVYDDLGVAYEDAVLESQAAGDFDSIQVQDWRAKTLSQEVAWGPTENNELLSAFDSPVFVRSVEYVQDYQPLHWSDIRDGIAQSTQRLVGDARVGRQRVESVLKVPLHDLPLKRDLETESRLPDEAKNHSYVRSLLEFMTLSLPAEAFSANQQAAALNMPLTLDFGDEALDEEEDGDEDESHNTQNGARGADGANGRTSATSKAEDRLRKTLQKMRQNRRIEMPRGFATLASHWLATEARMPGSEKKERMIALVSRSGNLAKVFHIDQQNNVDEYLMDLNLAIAKHDDGPGAAMRLLRTQPLGAANQWVRERFDQVWGSIDPDVELLDLKACTDAAAQVMEAKKIIGLQQTEFSTVEEALSAPEHNAVKEAHFRQHFMRSVMGGLVPGVRIYVSNRQGSSAHDIFDRNGYALITDVEIPAAGQESMLSRWKYHVVYPGDVTPRRVSASMIFKRAGQAPNFPLLDNTGNVFAGSGAEARELARGLESFTKGPVRRRKTLLVGNMFQANEWARETRSGQATIYTDEAGQRHRAIEVDGGTRYTATRLIRDFPCRLHDRTSIREFMGKLFTPAQDQAGAVRMPVNADDTGVMFTSFRGVLSERNKDQDMLLVSVEKNALVWMIDKNEKEKIRRSLRNGLKLDRLQWDKSHAGEEYPITVAPKTSVPRASKRVQVPLTITLPPTQEGRDRFFDILVRTVGMQLYIPRQKVGGYGENALYPIGRQVERRYYQRLTEPAQEDRDRFLAMRARREAHRSMMTTAFGAAAPRMEGRSPVESTAAGAHSQTSISNDASTRSPAPPSELVSTDQVHEGGMQTEGAESGLMPDVPLVANPYGATALQMDAQRP